MVYHVRPICVFISRMCTYRLWSSTIGEITYIAFKFNFVMIDGHWFDFKANNPILVSIKMNNKTENYTLSIACTAWCVPPRLLTLYGHDTLIRISNGYLYTHYCHQLNQDDNHAQIGPLDCPANPLWNLSYVLQLPLVNYQPI